MKINLFFIILSISLMANAAKVLDGDSWKSPDHTKTWTPPSATDTLVGRASTDTLTNKSISGSTNTFTAIPLSGLAPVGTAGQILESNGGSAPAYASPWYVYASLTGANPDMGTSAQTSYIDITNSSMTLTPASGSAAAGTTCSTTSAATAPSTSPTTCAAGSEDIGLNFTIPTTGVAVPYEVCFAFTHYYRLDTAVQITPVFQIYETPTNAQTLTTAGGTAVSSGGLGQAVATGANADTYSGLRVCGVFTWTSGTKAVRLMYVQAVNGTPDTNVIMADGNSGSSGGRNVAITVSRFR